LQRSPAPKSPATQQLHAIIRGRVQGVGFRQNTVLKARRLGLVGWVCNLPDRSVETVAIGPQEPLETFLAWLHKGPEGANVTGVEASRSEPLKTFSTFEIIYGTD
jgi:acylphosphatase